MREESTQETTPEDLIRKAEAGAAALSPVVARLISQQINEIRATYRLTKVILGIAIATLAVGIASVVIPLLTRN
jgi:hypothetical protein